MITPLSLHSTALLLLVAFEWLFFVTKPSFMTSLGWGTATLLLLTMGIAAWIFGIALNFVALKIDRELQKRRGFKNFWASAFVPSLVLTGLVILLVDNFTYTVFKWGIEHTNTWTRIPYLLAGGAIFAAWLLHLSAAPALGRSRLKIKWLIGAGAAVLAAVFCYRTMDSSLSYERQWQRSSSEAKTPNIIFFASDGIEATHTSAYGYERKTTPHLDALKDQMLVVENAITNSGKSTGAVTSLLTGKLPTSTKVFFPPHILKGKDSVEHLPALLTHLGYRNFQESVRYYLDGGDLGMASAFEIANQRDARGLEAILPESLYRTFYDEFFFAKIIAERLGERIGHLTGVSPIVNPYKIAMNQAITVYGHSDSEKIERAIKFMGESSGPFFVHIHLMDTHCCSYRPPTQVFSIKKRPHGGSKAHYDDAILASDAHFGRLIAWLKESGKINNTLIVYYSDHGRHWSAAHRVPLMIYFPQKDHVGAIRETAQLADVVPTILDYMGYKKPAWVEGDSLIGEPLDPLRPIVSIASITFKRFSSKGNESLAKLKGAGPPYYGARFFAVTICEKQYLFSAAEGTMESREIKEHTAPCGEKASNEDMARALLDKHLRERGIGTKVANQSS